MAPHAGDFVSDEDSAPPVQLLHRRATRHGPAADGNPQTQSGFVETVALNCDTRFGSANDGSYLKIYRRSNRRIRAAFLPKTIGGCSIRHFGQPRHLGTSMPSEGRPPHHFQLF